MKYSAVFVLSVTVQNPVPDAPSYICKKKDVSVPPAQFVQNLPVLIDRTVGKRKVQNYGYYVEGDILVIRVNPPIRVQKHNELLDFQKAGWRDINHMDGDLEGVIQQLM